MKFELWYPLDEFVISQNFGENAAYYQKNYGIQGHNGIDMVGRTGQIIRAAHDGVVVSVSEDANSGFGIVIRTNEPFDYNGSPTMFKSIYWHVLPDSILVSQGQQVKAGDIIAKCDSSGILLNVDGFNTQGADAASHLHFGVKPVDKGELSFIWYNTEQKNGYNGAVDPAQFWNKYFAKDAQQIISNLSEQISLAQKILNLLKQFLGLS